MKWEDNVRKVEPYIPGEQPKEANVIKLNTNECPYPPAPSVQKKLQELDYDKLRLYPDTQAEALEKELCRHYGIKPEQLFIGVGSDDVLAMSFLTFFNSQKPILFPDITYSFYEVWADLFRIPYEKISLKDDFTIEKEDYLKENGGIIIPNPNAPTGVAEEIDMLEEIISGNRDQVVIIDEAYVDFGGDSCLRLIDKYDNLMVVQTFSKSRSLAGLRIGYAMGNSKLIGYLKDAKFSFNSYTMNMPSIELGAEALKDEKYFKETVDKVIVTREWVKEELSLLGFTFTDSKSNFIFASHDTIPAEEIFNMLKKKNIYVRFWNKPRIQNYLRISIGTKEQMDCLLESLREIVR